MTAMTSPLNRPKDRLPEMVCVAITRVKKGASYLSDEERRIFDGYDGPVVVGAADVQESSAQPNLQKDAIMKPLKQRRLRHGLSSSCCRLH